MTKTQSARRRSTPDERKPLTIIALGRGRTGKTTLLDAIVQHYRGQGAQLCVLNADLQNASESIATFHPDAVSATGEKATELQGWIEARLEEQAVGRYDVILDLAGGDGTVKALGEELGLIETMHELGLRPVALHVVGSSPADLDFLRQVYSEASFAPEATIIAINEALLGGGAADRQALAKIAADPIVVEAERRGAAVVLFERLTCMKEFRDSGLTFAQAGHAGAGHSGLSFFNQVRVRKWFEEKLPEMLSEIPAEWMPRMSQPALAEAPAE